MLFTPPGLDRELQLTEELIRGREEGWNEWDERITGPAPAPVGVYPAEGDHVVDYQVAVVPTCNVINVDLWPSANEATAAQRWLRRHHAFRPRPARAL